MSASSGIEQNNNPPQITTPCPECSELVRAGYAGRFAVCFVHELEAENNRLRAKISEICGMVDEDRRPS